MTISEPAGSALSRRSRLEPVGLLVVVVAFGGLLLPFVLFKPNRIAPGDGLFIWEALPPILAVLGLAFWAICVALGLFRKPPAVKLAAGVSGLVVTILLVGLSAQSLTPPDNSFARVGIGGGFWLISFAMGLLVIDALSRMQLGPWRRMGLLAVSVAAMWVVLWSGVWNDLSLLKEYASRAPTFWKEARTHLLLAFGSVFLATALGLPLGLLCYKLAGLRAAVLNALNVIQTIPSIALFGVLIAPLAWIAANIPGAAALGVSGIGIAPAMVALTGYALLPVVANTVVGLTGLPETTVEAARGMGMTSWQRLMQVEIPLAFPVILTGIRIVLVQNIGLATIAALIGGGGFGVFVFQGVGQTAIDLVLLGAAPTVALAFVAAVLLDSIIELSSRRASV